MHSKHSVGILLRVKVVWKKKYPEDWDVEEEFLLPLRLQKLQSICPIDDGNFCAVRGIPQENCQNNGMKFVKLEC